METWVSSVLRGTLDVLVNLNRSSSVAPTLSIAWFGSLTFTPSRGLGLRTPNPPLNFATFAALNVVVLAALPSPPIRANAETVAT